MHIRSLPFAFLLLFAFVVLASRPASARWDAIANVIFPDFDGEMIVPDSDDDAFIVVPDSDGDEFSVVPDADGHEFMVVPDFDGDEITGPDLSGDEECHGWTPQSGHRRALYLLGPSTNLDWRFLRSNP